MEKAGLPCFFYVQDKLKKSEKDREKKDDQGNSHKISFADTLKNAIMEAENHRISGRMQIGEKR